MYVNRNELVSLYGVTQTNGPRVFRLIRIGARFFFWVTLLVPYISGSGCGPPKFLNIFCGLVNLKNHPKTSC